MNPDLKPCPFCGRENILVKKRKTTMVECAGCGVVVFDVQNGKHRDPFSLWNTRSDADAQAEIARLRGALKDMVALYDSDDGCKSLPAVITAREALKI